VKVIIDSREPDNVKQQAELELQNAGHTTSIEQLDEGDFYLPNYDVVVERKEANDFVSSTTEGRLSKQADRMTTHNYGFVVIENPVRYSKRLKGVKSLFNQPYVNVSENSVIGMQTSLTVKRGISLLYTESVEQTCYMVRRLFERFEQSEHEEAAGSSHVKTSDVGEVEDVQVAMLMQIEGISQSKAEKILEIKPLPWYSYKAQEDVAQMRENIMRVDGVGEVLAERVISAFQ